MSSHGHGMSPAGSSGIGESEFARLREKVTVG